MDPHATLEEILEHARYLGQDETPGSAADDAEVGYQLADKVLALDEWRRKGGVDPYLPDPGLAVTGPELYNAAYPTERPLLGAIAQRVLAAREAAGAVAEPVDVEVGT